MDGTSFAGAPLPEQVVVIQRGPVSNVATALADQDPGCTSRMTIIHRR